MRGRERGLPLDVPALLVRLPEGGVLRFSQTFHIGRDPDCGVQIQDVHVSRRHAVVSVTGGAWSIRDLQSSNGLLVDGDRVEHIAIGEGVTVSLGLDGPSLHMYPETLGRAPAAIEDEDPIESSVLLDGYAQHYFGESSEKEAGPRTMMIRKAFRKVEQQQKRRHRLIVAVVAMAGLFAGGYAYYAHLQMKRMAAELEVDFYAMKALEVRIAAAEQEPALAGDAGKQQAVKIEVAQRRQKQASFNEKASLYDRRLSEKERLIHKVTRMFGECDVAAPPGYINEVMRFIQYWQTTGRFKRAVKLAHDVGYTQKIAEAFIAEDLPPQYFYLAMQESDFDAYRSGPKTRWGFAKGMWQFIPETGARYGLNIGPLSATPLADPADDRLKWEKATYAATKYIKYIYETDAKASGLLVMASYNWGERRVLDIVKKMPEDPRQRNFWKLLELGGGRLPDETYNYVFYIVSAAVIGENPRLFGFDIDPPLRFLNQQ